MILIHTQQSPHIMAITMLNDGIMVGSSPMDSEKTDILIGALKYGQNGHFDMILNASG